MFPSPQVGSELDVGFHSVPPSSVFPSPQVGSEPEIHRLFADVWESFHPLKSGRNLGEVKHQISRRWFPSPQVGSELNRLRSIVGSD